MNYIFRKHPHTTVDQRHLPLSRTHSYTRIWLRVQKQKRPITLVEFPRKFKMDAARAAWTIMQLFDVLCKTKRTPNYPGILGSDENATHNGKLFDISIRSVKLRSIQAQKRSPLSLLQLKDSQNRGWVPFENERWNTYTGAKLYFQVTMRFLSALLFLKPSQYILSFWSNSHNDKFDTNLICKSGLVLWTSTSQTGQWNDVWRYFTMQLRQTTDKRRFAMCIVNEMFRHAGRISNK